MAKYGRAKKYTEEDGYWFSTENGSHIHVDKGQTPREAVEKRFGKNKDAQSYNGARARKPENPNFNEKEFGEFFDENWQLIKGKEDEYFDKVNRLNKETYDKNYNQAKEINNYEKVKNIYDRQVEDKGEDSPEARGTKKALDEFKENFDKGNSARAKANENIIKRDYNNNEWATEYTNETGDAVYFDGGDLVDSETGITITTLGEAGTQRDDLRKEVDDYFKGEHSSRVNRLAQKISELDNDGILKTYDIDEVQDKLYDLELDYAYSRKDVERAIDQYVNEEQDKQDYEDKGVYNATQQPFKLDKKKYPDVEETRYGFIYNVDGNSIEDIGEHMRKAGYDVKENEINGFSVYKDGDEHWFKTWDEAYNFAKRKNNKERENKKKEYKRQEAEEQRNNLKKDVQRLIKDYGFTLDELVEFLKK